MLRDQQMTSKSRQLFFCHKILTISSLSLSLSPLLPAPLSPLPPTEIQAEVDDVQKGTSWS